MINNVITDKKICMSIHQFKNYFLTHNYNENMFNSDGSINPKYNSNKKTGIIAQIFEDHWDNFYKSNKAKINMYRPNAPIEIQKIKQQARKFRKELLRHELSIIKSFNHSPYDCPKCSIRMNFMCVVTL